MLFLVLNAFRPWRTFLRRATASDEQVYRAELQTLYQGGPKELADELVTRHPGDQRLRALLRTELPS